MDWCSLLVRMDWSVFQIRNNFWVQYLAGCESIETRLLASYSLFMKFLFLLGHGASTIMNRVVKRNSRTKSSVCLTSFSLLSSDHLTNIISRCKYN